MRWRSSFKEDYLQAYTLKSWLLTTDHKRIGLLYMASITFFFFVGGAAATVMRLELMTPKGDVLSSPDAYNRLFTIHGVVMIFFFLIPSIPAVLGNFLIPLMIGARDLAFPILNLLCWYIFMIGGSIAIGDPDLRRGRHRLDLLYAVQHDVLQHDGRAGGDGGVHHGLLVDPDRSELHRDGPHDAGPGDDVVPAAACSSGRLYATSLIMVLGTPVLAISVALVAVERLLHVGIFDPALGGDPILFQHLFWFYSHPAVYIMVLPGMGVVSEIVPCFSRRPIFGYKLIAFSSVAIAVLGFLVWGHHMFVSGQSMYAGMVFSFLSFLVAIPSAIKVFNWTATMYKGSIRLDTPMLYALGFIGLFTMGGLTGLMLASLAIDVHVHDTYFVVAHFHYIMVGGAVMAYLGGIHFWWPKLSGRMYPELLGKLSALTVFVGFNLTFFPQFVLGYLGMPRRYYEYPAEFQVLNVMSTAGASILAVGYVLPLAYLLFSLRRPP